VPKQLKKMSDEKEENQMELRTAQTEDVAPAESVSGSEVYFELSEPRWSVVTFETCAAKNLTYDEAFQKMKELNEQNFSGLCIVTDEAAARIT
jgi:hypothetical protein